MTDRAMMRVLGGERVFPPPLWIMRLAARYLPECRRLRRQAKKFLSFCYSPALATEAVLQPPPGMQGNLDPQYLVCGGGALEDGARHVLKAFDSSPHIFNLGHGITPQTPPERVAVLVDIVERS